MVVYAFTVHWVIAPVYLMTVPPARHPELGPQRKINVIQKVIVAETTAWGSTTESLRNIELVRAGPGAAEIAMLTPRPTRSAARC